MLVRCLTCGRRYDDVHKWTICPHGPLGFGVSDYCTMHDLVISQSNGVCTEACKAAAVRASSIYIYGAGR